MKLSLTLAVLFVCFAISLAVDAPPHNKKHHNKKHLKKHGASAKRELDDPDQDPQENGDSGINTPENSCFCPACEITTEPQEAKRHKKHKKHHVAKRDADDSDPDQPPTDDENPDAFLHECPKEDCDKICSEQPEPAENGGTEDAQKKKKHAGMKRHKKHHV